MLDVFMAKTPGLINLSTHHESDSVWYAQLQYDMEYKGDYGCSVNIFTFMEAYKNLLEILIHVVSSPEFAVQVLCSHMH